MSGARPWKAVGKLERWGSAALLPKGLDAFCASSVGHALHLGMGDDFAKVLLNKCLDVGRQSDELTGHAHKGGTDHLFHKFIRKPADLPGERFIREVPRFMVKQGFAIQEVGVGMAVFAKGASRIEEV